MTTIDDLTTAPDEVIPDLELDGPDVAGLDAVLGRAKAGAPTFRLEPADRARFDADLRDAGVARTLADFANRDQAAVVEAIRRIATVSTVSAREFADLVEALAHVNETGDATHRRRVHEVIAQGERVALAERGSAVPGAHHVAVVASVTSLVTSAVLVVVPVDLPGGGRATALVETEAGAVPAAGTPVADGELLTGQPAIPTSLSRLVRAAVMVGTAERLVAAAAHVARDNARPWSGRTYDRLIDDPYVLARFGHVRAELHGVQRLLRDAAGESASTRDRAVVVEVSAEVLASIVAELPELVGSDSITIDALWEAAREARSLTLRDSVAWGEAIAGQALLVPSPGRATTADVDARGVVADAPVAVVLDAQEAIDVARQYAVGVGVDAAVRDRDRRHPHDELAALGRTGLLGLTVPREFGGAGATTATVAEVVRSIAAADGSVAQILQPHFGALEMIALSGTPDQKRVFFGAAVAGERFGNANAELGTQAAGDIRTRLIHAPDGGFTVDGKKAYTTGSFSADWIPVSVRDPAGNRASAIVRRDADGVDVIDDWSGIGQRTTASGSATFTGVRVFEQQVIAQWRAGQGSQLTGAKGNIVHAAINVGIAAGALDATRDYVVHRARPSKDLAIETVLEDPHVVRRFGRLAGRLALAESSLAYAADLVDIADSLRTPESISAATIAVAEAESLGSEVGLEISSDLFSLAGASSSRTELGLDRFWRDVRTHSLHDTMIWKYHQSGDSLLSGAFYFANRRTVL